MTVFTHLHLGKTWLNTPPASSVTEGWEGRWWGSSILCSLRITSKHWWEKQLHVAVCYLHLLQLRGWFVEEREGGGWRPACYRNILKAVLLMPRLLNIRVCNLPVHHCLLIKLCKSSSGYVPICCDALFVRLFIWLVQLISSSPGLCAAGSEWYPVGCVVLKLHFLLTASVVCAMFSRGNNRCNAA